MLPVSSLSPIMERSTQSALKQAVSPHPGAPHRQTAGASMFRGSGVTVILTPAQAALGADHQEEAMEEGAAMEEDLEEDQEAGLVADLEEDPGEDKTQLV